MKIGYNRGYRDGVAETKELYERQLAVVREQLADARAEAQQANTRAEGMLDQLMLRIGVQPVSPMAQQLRVDMARNLMDRHGVVQETDPFEELPLGAEGSSYKTAEDAALNGND